MLSGWRINKHRQAWAYSIMNQGKRHFYYGYRLVSQLNLVAIGHTLYSARSDFRPLTSSMVCFEIMLGINNCTDNSFTYFEESAAEKLQCGDAFAVSYYDVPQTEPSDFYKEGQGQGLHLQLLTVSCS